MRPVGVRVRCPGGQGRPVSPTDPLLNMLPHLALVFAMALPMVADLAGGAEVRPVSQEAYSWDLQDEGLKNGSLPDTRLIEVDGCLLERDAGYTMSLMIEAAAADGVRIDPGSCYRSVEQQQATYERNCPLITDTVPLVDPITGEQLVDDDGAPLVSISRYRVCSIPTATPSKSNHGWGRAVDLLVNGRAMTCRDRAFHWLEEHAADFGWIHPEWAGCGEPLEEAWHWEYGGLELIPLESRTPRDIVIPAGAE